MVFSKEANMEEPIYDPASPFPSVSVVYKYALVNCPSKTIMALRVNFPPLAATPPHTHHGASVTVVVLSGSLLNKMNDEPMTIKDAGDSFYEAPGCRHRISANHSKTEEASLLATFVIDTETVERVLKESGPNGMVVVDEEWIPVIEEYQKKKAGA